MALHERGLAGLVTGEPPDGLHFRQSIFPTADQAARTAGQTLADIAADPSTAAAFALREAASQAARAAQQPGVTPQTQAELSHLAAAIKDFFKR